VPEHRACNEAGEHDHNSQGALASVARIEGEAMDTIKHSLIESIGVYLPAKIMTTDDVLQGCTNPISFPLERFTGIKTRRVAAEGEFSIDLAKRAVERCLERSKYTPDQMDILICCNISRCDGPNTQFSFEPSTAMRLKESFGFDRALVFDISNACSGFFTAMSIIDALIKVGTIERGMAVSGEYITCVTKTAQKEIQGFMDPRLPCLNLGDSGAAVILEGTRDISVGFHAIDLITLGKYSSYCVSQQTDQEHGGPIMLTDPIRLSVVAIKESIKHIQSLLQRAQVSPESIPHIIMHQTALTTIENAMREANKTFGREICHRGNVLIDLEERGSTSTNSHPITVMDNILNTRIQSGETVLFSTTGSGITVGSALYTFDDLPTRIRLSSLPIKQNQKRRGSENTWSAASTIPRIGIEAVGIERGEAEKDTVGLALSAIKDCFARSLYQWADIDAIIYSGLYRTNHLSEPAVAAIIAGELDALQEEQRKRSVFAFDLLNGALGVLDACCVGSGYIRSGKYQRIMLSASEVENNRELAPDHLRGIEETGSALILHEGKTGFGRFFFRAFPEYIGAFTAFTTMKSGKAIMRFQALADLERIYMYCILTTVREILQMEGLS